MADKPLTEGNNDFVLLMKDSKIICRTECINPPAHLPRLWNLHEIVKRSELSIHHDLPHCFLRSAAECDRDQNEWVRFLSHLQKANLVGIAKFGSCNFYILPPVEASKNSHVRVAYKMEAFSKYSDQMQSESGYSNMGQSLDPIENYGNEKTMSPSLNVGELITETGVKMTARNISSNKEDSTCHGKFPRPIGDCHASKLTIRHQPCAKTQDEPLMQNYVRLGLHCLRLLSHAHSGWIFGAIAELVDNSRDAKASRLDISIEPVYSKIAGKVIPMLSIRDDGHGMSHNEVLKMTCLEHMQSDTDDLDRIGRYGVGFKTGTMRLGRDAFVLTQTDKSNSIAFFSQSLNEGKESIVVPIVSYSRSGQFMELDANVQSEALAKHNLKAIKDFSHFDKYMIGAKAALFGRNSTGTQIYIWNLDELGSNYSLDWTVGLLGRSSFHQGDILIRSKKIRLRPGQRTQKVPLDYSLRSYLEVFFLVPRMRIYVQGSLVKSRPLAKSLYNTCEATGTILGKHVRLTLGCCQLEWEQANCGIFLYWHGRLIEAYKRVGSMIHNGDVGRGVIGVIDVTALMDNGNGRVWLDNKKQGFLECESYVRLEEWLGLQVDKYLDNNYDSVQLKKGGFLHKPDHEWIQCDKCRKWRMLSSGFDTKDLPLEWFCYMKPFHGSCEMPEQNVGREMIAVSTKRSGHDVQNLQGDATTK